LRRASAGLSKLSSFGHSSRRLPLNDPMQPFCCGLPVSMDCHSTVVSFAHFRIALLVGSVPLSETIHAGVPWTLSCSDLPSHLSSSVSARRKGAS
jgi:hypothetical protein